MAKTVQTLNLPRSGELQTKIMCLADYPSGVAIVAEQYILPLGMCKYEVFCIN